MILAAKQIPRAYHPSLPKLLSKLRGTVQTASFSEGKGKGKEEEKEEEEGEGEVDQGEDEEEQEVQGGSQYGEEEHDPSE